MKVIIIAFTKKEANWYMKVLLVVFWGKIHLGQYDLFSL